MLLVNRPGDGHTEIFKGRTKNRAVAKSKHRESYPLMALLLQAEHSFTLSLRRTPSPFGPMGEQQERTSNVHIVLCSIQKGPNNGSPKTQETEPPKKQH